MIFRERTERTGNRDVDEQPQGIEWKLVIIERAGEPRHRPKRPEVIDEMSESNQGTRFLDRG